MPQRILKARVYVPVIAIVLLSAFPLMVFAWAIVTNQDSGEKLCAIVYAQIARGGAQIGRKGSPGYAYYRKHPVELATARAQNQEFLRLLPCRAGSDPPLRTERK